MIYFSIIIMLYVPQQFIEALFECDWLLAGCHIYAYLQLYKI